MKKAIPLAIAAVVAGATAACAVLDQARIYGAEAAGRAVGLECALSMVEREKNLLAINGWLTAQGMTGRATALDCDGDGSPDF